MSRFDHMKTLAVASVAACMFMHVRADQEDPAPARIKIEITYKDVDDKWFSALGTGIANHRKDNGEVTLPTVTGRSGEELSIEIIKFFRKDASKPDGPTIECGIMIGITPVLDGKTIRLHGTDRLRYPTDRTAPGTASRFASRENLIDVTLEDGVTKAIDLDDGGRMLITATRIEPLQ